MRIRTRMAAIAIAVSLPQVVGLTWWDAASRHDAAEVALTGLLERAVAEPGARQGCLADPLAWSTIEGRRPPPERRRPPEGRPPPPHHRHRVAPPKLSAYDAEARSVGDAPSLGLEPASMVVGRPTPRPESAWSSEVVVALRTGWGGACEVVAVRGTTVPGFLGVLPATPMWVAPIVIVSTVMWLAVAPVVSRLRRLTRAVHDDEPLQTEGSDEIAELARAFDAARSAVKAALEERRAREQALREFVANTAHDVRIPLTVLRGHLVTLEEEPDPEVVAAAIREAHYLSALLDDLAAHARMEAPSPPGPVDLGELVQRVRSRHTPIARREGIAIEVGVPPDPVFVVGDLTLVEQAVSNLVYNAIRHNRSGGHVAITVDGDADRFALVVLDDGPGVPADELQRLVERGYRGTDARGRDGHGLGLAIVARVVEAHGWSLTLQTPEEGGLEARIEGSRG